MAVRGINPELVVVLPAGRALEGLKGGAAIGRAVHRGAHGVQNVRILRVHEHAAAISALAVADPRVPFPAMCCQVAPPSSER